MRASFLLILAVALLLGLGVAVLVKASGLLNPPAPAVVQPAPPPPPPPTVLAAAHNIYSGDTIRPGDVRLRPLRPDEIAHYETNRDKYVAPVLDAANYRFPNRNIAADQPILKADLKELEKPEPLASRLLPGMRAVDVSITKDNSAGGLIGVGDWVDVYLSSDVGRSDAPGKSMHTALLAQSVPVVAKRNTLWPLFAPLPPDKPIEYTLGVNPYRAALIDYARSRGILSLVPVSAAEKTRLDDYQKAVKAGKTPTVAFPLDPNSPDSKEEEARIAAYNRGEQAVGPTDLIRLFALKPLQPPTPPLSVEMYAGTQQRGVMRFVSPRGSGTLSNGGAAPLAPHYEFSMPPSPESKETKPAAPRGKGR